MKKTILHWLPRIITILAILFMMVFSIDCFGEYASWDKKLICFFMHNIPAFILAAVLFIAWKWPYPGGLLFIVAAIVASILFRSFSGNPYSLIVIFPFLLTGVLFILDSKNYMKSEKNS